MIAEHHLDELKALCPGAKQATEAGIDYVLLPSLVMRKACSPASVDCLLCLGARDGYDNRLFFAQMITCKAPPNWNGINIRIFERNWFAFSWRVPGGLRPIETLIAHMQGLR